jgi:hypothetical protein
MMKIAKIIKKGKEYFVEVLKVGSVHFDPRPGWVFVQTIERRYKDVEWVHPDDVYFVWVRDFT